MALPLQALMFVGEHCTHAPVAPQAGVVPPQSASDLQPTHLCVVRSHAGLVPEQVALVRHSTHVPESR